jgi:hypothetical protein
VDLWRSVKCASGLALPNPAAFWQSCAAWLFRPTFFDDNGQPLREQDSDRWCEWIGRDENRVIWHTDLFDGVIVSTAFLGVDHNFSARGAPILWETVIVRGSHVQYQERYSSSSAAFAGHNAARLRWRKAKRHIMWHLRGGNNKMRPQGQRNLNNPPHIPRAAIRPYSEAGRRINARPNERKDGLLNVSEVREWDYVQTTKSHAD